MRRAPVLALLSLILTANPARAEFPAALSAWAGAGRSSGHREEVGGSAPSGVWGIDAAWRFAPGRALVAYEGAGQGGMMFIPESPHLSRLEHWAITVGPEFSSPPRSGVAFFCRASAGVGRVTSAGSRGLRITDTRVNALPGLVPLTEIGFAMSGVVGVRLIPPPGPLGFTLALRAARTAAGHSSSGGIGVTAGFTLYPLDRRPTAPTAP